MQMKASSSKSSPRLVENFQSFWKLLVNKPKRDKWKALARSKLDRMRRYVRERESKTQSSNLQSKYKQATTTSIAAEAA